MPTSVVSSSGVSYHLWQLPDLTTPEPEDTIQFTTLDNDLSDGYRATNLFGSNTGVRSWTLKFPTLAHIDVLPNTVTDINGAAVSREQYLRSLYAENKVTGQPFAYADPGTGQYYLVDFEDEELSLQRMRIKLYSTGLKLKQRRIEGETIFDAGIRYGNQDAAYPTLWLKGSGYVDGTEEWVSTGGAWVITGSGDVNEVAAAQNGQNIVRLSSTTNDGVITAVGGPTFKECFVVMKMREAAFSNAAGIITGDGAADAQVLIGSSGTTKFADLSLTGYEYFLNGLEYGPTDQQAPMNAWGVVRLRYPTGWNLSADNLQIGKNRTTAGTFAELDLGEMLFFTSLLSNAVAREITEHLIVKWGIV